MNPVLAPVSLLLTTVSPPAAQQPVAPPAPAATASPAPPADTLPFGDEGTRMTVPVTIAGAGPYRFVVDTGAERTVISRELAGTLGLAPGREVRLTAMADVVNVGTVVIPMISVGAIGGMRIEAPALESRNLGAPGMLGIDTLQGHALAIDFDRQVMTVTPSVKLRHPDYAAPDEIVVHARSIYGQLVVTDAYYNNIRIKVIIDTGSAVTMGNLALRRQVARNRHKLISISLLSVTGAYLQADYTQIERVRIGDANFANLPVAFADAAPFRRFGLADKPALLLGMDSLRLFSRVKIDFANRQLRLSLPRGAEREFGPQTIATF